jgi:SSS family solute:Na+ symporter
MASQQLGAANVVVLVLYLVVVLGAALWVAQGRRAGANRSGEEYFLASRTLPGWQLGLSLIATMMSSITFLAFPATAFRTNWLLLHKDLTVPIVCAIAAVWVVPFYRREVRFSVFELLERRFNLFCRIYCSLCYIVLQLARTCSVLYLTSFPMAGLTGASLPTVTILLGCMVAGYTCLGWAMARFPPPPAPLSRPTPLAMIGVCMHCVCCVCAFAPGSGFAAVVFTDVVQSLTLLIGGVTMVAVCVSDAGGVASVIANASAVGKFSMMVDASDAGRSPGVLWLFGLTMYWITVTVYQDAVQRYCAARSLRQARLAIAIQGVIAVPTWICFLFLGTSLYVLSTLPAGALLRPGANATMDVDAIVGTFALAYLPPGAGGLVLAGVLAAAMSSLDSSLNSVAVIITTDFVQRLWLRGAPLAQSRVLSLGRRSSVTVAALTVLGALMLQHVEKEGMNDLYNGLMSITGGASGGLMLLTIFTRGGGECAEQDTRWRWPTIDSTAAIAGIILSAAVSLFATLCSFDAFGSACSISYYWVLPLSNAAFAVGILLFALLAHAGLRSLASKADSGRTLASFSAQDHSSTTASALGHGDL